MNHYWLVIGNFCGWVIKIHILNFKLDFCVHAVNFHENNLVTLALLHEP